MRTCININNGWLFSKEDLPEYASHDFPKTNADTINIPHTWNQFDGQDGGNNYFRGGCWYQKRLSLPDIGNDKELYIEFGAVNSVADVYINGKKLSSHAGGYSGFRVNISEFAGMKDVLLCVRADNSDNPDVYPRTADYTFYGGIYRDVTLCMVHKTHFAMNEYGSSGIFVHAESANSCAEIRIESHVENPKAGLLVEYTILTQDGETIAKLQTEWCKSSVMLHVQNPHLWNGRKDPYLYRLHATLIDHQNTDKVMDTMDVTFGIRSFFVDLEQGFFLNGERYPLHGVSRHQDRKDMGWAISKAEHEEDMELICEIGATSIRLAHYQHDAYFYDLCDQKGMVVWAEIPFISQMSKTEMACDNLRSQMIELIMQNYNHPSICFWGLQNEITIQDMTSKEEEDPELVSMVSQLHMLAKKLDPNRLTCQACLGNVQGNSKLANISDLTSYNHYFGWYIGEAKDLGIWMDKFHSNHPQIRIGLSEYGGDGSVRYHNDEPRANDYSEEYQAILHEQLEEILDARPYVWSSYVWNMFDFGSDRRDEGGAPGLNQKGLVTYDRKIKKDAFYLYKAYWSEDAFIHICGHTYINRMAKEREIKVYSNQSEVKLTHNGKEIATKKGKKVFCFKIFLELGKNIIQASAGNVMEELVLNGVANYDKSYKMTELEGKDGIVNWFKNADDFHFVHGTYSVNDRVSDILENLSGYKVLEKYFADNIGMDVLRMAKNFKLAKIISKAGKAFPSQLAVQLNDELSKIPKMEE